MRELTTTRTSKELLITQTYNDFTLNSTLKLFIKVNLCKDVLLTHEGPERHVRVWRAIILFMRVNALVL